MIGDTSIYKFNVVKLVVPIALLLSYIGKLQESPSVTRKLIHVKHEIRQKNKKIHQKNILK